MMQPRIRPMGVGEILDRSFQTLRSHFGTLVGTALIGFSPLLAIYVIAGVPYGSTPTDPLAAGLGVILIVLVPLMLVGLGVVWAGLTYQADQAAQGRSPGVVEGLKAGFRSLLRLVGVGILAYLALLGLMLPVAIMGGALAAIGGAIGSDVGAVLVVAAIAVLGVVAMVYWVALTFLILPALIVEGVGPIRALRRANGLAKGGRLRVSATAILAWLIVALPAFGIPFLLGAGSMLWNPEAAGELGAVQLFLYQALTFGVSALTSPFLAATMVYTYYDRRVRREGYDVELASESITAGA